VAAVAAAAAAANSSNELPTRFRQFSAAEKLDAPAWDHSPAPVRFFVCQRGSDRRFCSGPNYNKSINSGGSILARLRDPSLAKRKVRRFTMTFLRMADNSDL
jgi:hypothetical protein